MSSLQTSFPLVSTLVKELTRALRGAFRYAAVYEVPGGASNSGISDACQPCVTEETVFRITLVSKGVA